MNIALIYGWYSLAILLGLLIGSQFLPIAQQQVHVSANAETVFWAQPTESTITVVYDPNCVPCRESFAQSVMPVLDTITNTRLSVLPINLSGDDSAYRNLLCALNAPGDKESVYNMLTTGEIPEGNCSDDDLLPLIGVLERLTQGIESLPLTYVNNATLQGNPSPSVVRAALQQTHQVQLVTQR